MIIKESDSESKRVNNNKDLIVNVGCNSFNGVINEREKLILIHLPMTGIKGTQLSKEGMRKRGLRKRKTVRQG